MTLRLLAAALALVSTTALAQDDADQTDPDRDTADQTAEDFELQRRPGSVDLEAEYDMSDLRIPEEEIHTLLPRDAIPSLTDPATQPASEADWLTPTSRVMLVEIGDEAVGVPLAILNFHEIVNMTVGGEPVAATYCPLCDSATLISRAVTHGGETEVLEFGVSGALYNSNVLMYDRTHKSLWSQLGMHAVSGALAGAALDHLPVRVVTFAEFQRRHPDAPVVSKDTGHERPYDRNVYQDYFDRDDLLVSVSGFGDALPKKTLGLGVLADGKSWFVVAGAITDDFTLDTPAGPVRAKRTDAGIEVTEASEGVHTAQTFYYAWSAFNRDTEVIKAD